MAILVSCPKCGIKLKAPDSSAGRQVKCPKCAGLIPVPAADEEPIDLAALGIKAEDPGRAPAQGRRQRPAEDEEYDERTRPSRRRREDDDDDDNGDYAPRRGRAGRRWRAAESPGDGLQVGLGIASLAVGSIGLLIAWIPILGAISLPLCAIGLTLGGIGLAVGIKKGSGTGLPIAGTSVSGLALALALVWIFLIARATHHVGQFAQEFDRAAKRMQMENAKNRALNRPKFVAKALAAPPTPPTGALALAGGKAQFNGQILDADPKDRVRLGSNCKVFTITLTAGKRYQFDMMSNALDSYLRLEDPEGVPLDEDDDGGADLNAQIAFACNRTGVYRIIATTLGPGRGPFTLTVAEQ